METDYPIKKIGWQDYDKLIENILDQLKGKQIDMIVPVLRGGAIPAMSLAGALDVPMAYIYVRRSVSNKPNSDFAEPVMLGEMNLSSIKNKTILICEDTIDTEETIKFVISQLKKYEPKQILVATLFNYSNNKYYAGYNAKDHFWVVFPWEKI